MFLLHYLDWQRRILNYGIDMIKQSLFIFLAVLDNILYLIVENFTLLVENCKHIFLLWSMP